MGRSPASYPLTVGVHTLFWTAMPMVVAPYAGRLGRLQREIRDDSVQNLDVLPGSIELARGAGDSGHVEPASS